MSRRGKTNVISDVPTATNKRERTRQLCFTLNNYTEEELKQLPMLYPAYVDYICYGREVGEQGTPHLQGYLRCASKTQMDWTVIHTWKGLERAHFIKTMGNAQQNRVYCAKGEQTKAEYDQFHPRKSEGVKPWSYSDPNWDHGPNYGKNAVFVEYGNPVDERGARSDIKK